MAQVFISYSRKDLPFVEQLATDLKNAGFDVWHDVSGLGGGSRWRSEIENALRRSQFVLVVLSPDSTASEWVEREFLFASQLKLKIIPLMYRPCELPLSYINLNYIDMQGENYQRKFPDLLRALTIDPKTATLPVTKKPAFQWKTTYFVSILVVLAMLFGGILVLNGNWFSPVTVTPVPTEPATAAIATEVPTDTPLPIPTATLTWEQGKIAYVARNAGKVYFLYTRDLSPAGQSQILLAPEKPTQSRYNAPWFASDGQLLTFADLYNGQIYVIDIGRASSLRPLGSCSSPSFSPDGTRVVCASGETDYFPVYDIATGREVSTIYHGKSRAVLPAWSPDGTEIAFSILDEDRNASIWKVSVDGGDPIPLATNGTENYAPSWSPDGEWIAFQSTLTSDQSEIWIMRRDGSGLKQITFSGGGEIWSRGPCFSPDGNWLAFVSSQNGTDGPDFGEVFVISLLTGELRQVTDTGGYVYDWRVTWTK
jgi:Tol biopolymer transport system component